MTWFCEHSETLLGVVLGLMFGVPISFYLSLYSGLIVARRSRFDELRYELIRILQSLEWPPGSQTFVLLGGHRAFDITLVSADLFSLGHTEAGETVAKIEDEVSKELRRQNDFLTPEEMESKFTDWMRASRTVSPSRRVIFSPAPRLDRKARYDASSAA